MSVHTPRPCRIFPITIETPFGQVFCAYRVHADGSVSAPFLVSSGPAVFVSGAAPVYNALASGLDELLSDLWWTSLPLAEKLELDPEWKSA
jgi:hypothetical protein